MVLLRNKATASETNAFGEFHRCSYRIRLDRHSDVSYPNPQRYDSYLMERKTGSKALHSQVRIIGGAWRGRKLVFDQLPGLRPTGDRLRETLFNWLQFDLPGVRCLDLFAGSGALGFEAASRGASHVTLLESNLPTYRGLQRSAEFLQASAVNLEHTDALSWLGATQQSFQVVFVDPPFAEGLHQSTIDLLANRSVINGDGFVYIESAQETGYKTPQNWSLHREKTTANVVARLFTVASS